MIVDFEYTRIGDSIAVTVPCNDGLVGSPSRMAPPRYAGRRTPPPVRSGPAAICLPCHSACIAGSVNEWIPAFGAPPAEVTVPALLRYLSRDVTGGDSMGAK